MGRNMPRERSKFMAILSASHLKKYYGKDESLVKALDDVNVSVEHGQFVAVIGISGSGKSTLGEIFGDLQQYIGNRAIQRAGYPLTGRKGVPALSPQCAIYFPKSQRNP